MVIVDVIFRCILKKADDGTEFLWHGTRQWAFECFEMLQISCAVWSDFSSVSAAWRYLHTALSTHKSPLGDELNAIASLTRDVLERGSDVSLILRGVNKRCPLF